MGLSYLFKSGLELTGGVQEKASAASQKVPRVYSSTLASGGTVDTTTGIWTNKLLDLQTMNPLWGADLYESAPYNVDFDGLLCIGAGSNNTAHTVAWMKGTESLAGRDDFIWRYAVIAKGLPVVIPLETFSHSVLLNSEQENVGVQGMRLDLGLAFFTDFSDLQSFILGLQKGEIDESSTTPWTDAPLTTMTFSSIVLFNPMLTLSQIAFRGVGDISNGTFTYDIGNVNNDIAYIRLHIQDTDEEEAQFTDEEINRELHIQQGNIDRTIDALLTIKKLMLSNEPSGMQIGATAIRQDVDGRLKALSAGQSRQSGLESDVPGFRTSVNVTKRGDV